MEVAMKFFIKDPLEKTFDRLEENELFEIVTREVMNEEVIAGIWGRAFSDVEGDQEKAKALYIKYRVRDLKDRALVAQAILKEENAKRERQSSTKNQASSSKIQKPDTINEDIRSLHADEKEEAKWLIASIKTLKISSDTQSELDDYEQDIINNEIVFMDLRYLRSLKERLK
jgi:hypothetical protein